MKKCPVIAKLLSKKKCQFIISQAKDESIVLQHINI